MNPSREYVHAYFYGFDLTGVEPVDDILRAVASAGKMYHNTEEWGDPWDGDTPSEVQKIQTAADEAAEAWGKRTANELP